MKKAISIVCAAVVALGSVQVAVAGPMTQQGQHFTNGGQVIAVRDHDRRHQKPRFEKRGNSFYLNGHRGYRERHRGYRYYNGYYFPPAAFAFGFILNGILNGISR